MSPPISSISPTASTSPRTPPKPASSPPPPAASSSTAAASGANPPSPHSASSGTPSITPALTVVASRSAHQSGEFVRKAAGFLRQLGLPVRGDGINRCSILLPNRSRVVGVPSTEATVRCLSGVSLLVFDEAARASDDLYTALRPMLATTNGSLWLLSTPKGKRGFFYKVWQHGGPGWERHSVPASQCPRIPPEFLEEDRLSADEFKFREEYCCEFVLADGYLFDRDILEDALTGDEHAWKDRPV